MFKTRYFWGQTQSKNGSIRHLSNFRARCSKSFCLGADPELSMARAGQVMELMELTPLRNAMTGLPGVNGLSVEQRKRLTIAVELVANPSIIFMVGKATFVFLLHAS